MIETFLNYLALNRGLSANTIKAYNEALRDFAAYINDNYPHTRWSTVSKRMIDEYVVSLVAEDYSPASIKQHISALRTFYRTCAALHESETVHNPARYVSTPKLNEQLPKTIEPEAIRAALDSTSVDAQTKAAIAIILETGIRLQELLDLRASDIDSKSQSIRIHGKGNKERTVYYGPLTRQYGRKWRGEEHSPRGVRHMIFNALRPHSKAKQLSPHALRHTFATMMLNNGASTESLRKLLGHEHLETTEVYAKLSNERARSQYNQFMPTI